jgi:hypothetical protein
MSNRPTILVSTAANPANVISVNYLTGLVNAVRDLRAAEAAVKQQAVFIVSGEMPPLESPEPLSKIVYKRLDDEASLSLDVAMCTLFPSYTYEQRQEAALYDELAYRDIAGNVTAY